MERKLTKKAFVIGEKPENFDMNVPPVTGYDYLYRVRIESRNCPKVVVSDIDKTKFLNRQTVTIDEGNGFISARPGFAPNPEWKELQLETFNSYKQKMSEDRACLKQKFPRKAFPKIKFNQKWCLYCLGTEKHDLIYGRAEEPEESDGTSCIAISKEIRVSDFPYPPLLSIILYLNQGQIVKLLSYHIEWLEKIGFSHLQGEWLYALLVALEKPLDPDTCALLRSLSRHCSKLRNELPTPDHEFVQALNLLLLIVAHCFDQKDMSDDFISANRM
ncbi:gem-associated protein 2-like [Argiope bruennichi]|uniref:Gem-associated protein 2 n=1 Tax=Argiope bruennichi TaxID=94029 RepID=A0A8T0FJ95_ARGBR|nr:gem-associated protein 2-like [Argiope bruennichi]KAF8789609.1 Gem-associated protein 2 like protein [Argiope bruennichi]